MQIDAFGLYTQPSADTQRCVVHHEGADAAEVANLALHARMQLVERLRVPNSANTPDQKAFRLAKRGARQATLVGEALPFARLSACSAADRIA